MECTNVLLSFEAVVKLVAEYNGAGCGNIRTKGDTMSSRLDCDTNMDGDQTLLNHIVRDDVPAIRVASANVALAVLCSSFSMRVDCDNPPSLRTMLREVIGPTPTGDMVIAARKVTGATVKCDNPCGPNDLITRIASTFITDGTNTFVLLIADGTGDPVDCVTNKASMGELLSGALQPVGTCGMWAWKVSTP